MRAKILAVACFALLAFAAKPSFAQSNSPVLLPGGCGTGNATNSLSYLTVDSTLKLCVNATVSASISPFTPGASGARGTQLAVTTSDSSGSLPTNGGAVVVTNTGSNPIFCNVNGNVATTSDQEIAPSGGWFNFGIPTSQTALHCIATGGSSTANSLGGSGLATGTGGGSGGGSSSNASVSATGSAVPASATYFGMLVAGNLTGVTGTANGLKVDGSAVTQPVAVASGAVASGAYASGAFASGAFAVGAGADGWDVPEGHTTDTACPASGTATVVGCLRSAVNNAVTLGSASGGMTPKTLVGLTNTAGGTAVKASAGQVFKGQCYNPDATNSAVLEFFNTASVTLGTTAVFDFVEIGPGQNAGFTHSLVGVQYSTAITVAGVKTIGSATAPTTAIDCTVYFN